MNLNLDGKVAIVTGASRGLGRGAAAALVAEGANVVVCARGAERLQEAAAELQARAASGAKVVSVVADVSTPAGAEQVVAAAVDACGGVDVLVNNVGLGRGGGIEETSDEEWRDALDQTLMPAVRMTRLAVPHMRARGGGVVIIVSSIYGREAGGRMTYNAVKAAENSLAKSLAGQLAADNIRALAVAPGSILFPGGTWDARQQADPEGIASFISRELPFGRFGRVDEVGDVIAFLASPRASWISGTTIVVDGCQSRMF